MLHCGLLGEKLGHSYSPMIHNQLADYEYRLYECPPEQLGDFLKNGAWDGLNVTIPYKKAVLPYCQELSETAQRLGNVNTLVRRSDGTLYGDNTDAYGFESMVHTCGVDVAGKKALVLGSGGASNTVCAVLKSMGAEVVVISRSGENNYDNLDRHADAKVIVNTTPVGMYPKNGASPVNLKTFPQCECVLDVVYNPTRTALILQAEELGIPCKSGLHMLVGQAKRACERFTGTTIAGREIDRIEQFVDSHLENIVLIGMPGCGKSTVAALLGEKTGRTVYDADACIVEKIGMPIPEFFAQYGEGRFREVETEVLTELGKLSGAILSTGGGCVTREENYPLLHQNGRIFWLKRSLDKLPVDGRPISQANPLETILERRLPLYTRFADVTVNNDGELEETIRTIMEEVQ